MMKHAGSARNLEPALGALADRGHRVHLALDRLDDAEAPGLLDRLLSEHPTITVGSGPKKARERWTPAARGLRLGIDYLRYLEPRYADAAKLRARAREAAPPRLVRAAGLPVVRSRAGVRTLQAALRGVESALPAPARIEAFLRERRPDVVAVVPLVGLGSAQADYVRAARALGIATALPVFSWDNLTNKGLLRESPDVVAVWNEAQAREATELHGVPRERIAIAGAAAFDHWFEWSPSRDREAFGAEVGLRADRPLLLYLCSSPFIAPDEVGFVRRWLAALRAGPSALREANVLVRPHPQNAAQWDGARFDDPQIAVWPRAGANPVTGSARNDYYDSLHHAAAIVGINTSALIESAIVDRPVFSVLTEEFAGTQEGTLHFHHLADDETGVLNVDRSLAAHFERLDRVLAGDPATWRTRNRRFLETFVRPHGLDTPAGPLLADAIESAATRERLPEPRVARAARKAVRRLAASRAPAKPAKPPRPDALAEARTAVAALAAGDGPVIAGPWLSEVGYELLYWVPFLRWALETHPELEGRLHVLSRGGVERWYDGVHYLELFDLLEPEVLQARIEATAAEATGGLRKQMVETPLERELIEATGLAGAQSLSPALMYRAMRAMVKRRTLVDSPESRDLFRHRPLTAPDEPLPIELPDEYIAARFYFRASFPETPENVRWAREALAALAEVAPVVLLNPGRQYDDHADLAPAGGDRVVTLPEIEPRRNLAVQSAVLAGSRGYVGTYGGLAYLPCLLGVPSIGVHSNASKFKGYHLDLAQRVYSGDAFGALQVLDANVTDPAGAATFAAPA